MGKGFFLDGIQWMMEGKGGGWLSLFLLLLLCELRPCGGERPEGSEDFRVGVSGEYRDLYEATRDTEGLDSIISLHGTLDDDKDGSIEPSETGDFIRADLKSSDSAKRQKLFHDKDSEITVRDLWKTWLSSEVHNWTTEQTLEWLVHGVELPQYRGVFLSHGVNGSKIPLIAVNGQYLSRTLRVSNHIHRSKIAIKAMDVVLFGPPKENNSFLKDLVFTLVLLLAVTILLYAYHKNKKSQDQLKKMMEDMDKLGVAERDLLELQKKLQVKENKSRGSRSEEDSPARTAMQSVDETQEIKRLREEVEELRNQLYAAETELEDKCWQAPSILQVWLQISYEIESLGFTAKKKEAEKQLELAKDLCEKLKKKRSSLVGAFVSTHGHSINDIDKMIIEARAGLLEVTNDLEERSQRWKQIEMLCGVSIVNNPGLLLLQKQVRTVGRGRLALHSRMSSIADDYLDDSDTHSVAHSMSSIASARTPALKPRPYIRPPLSRESSKESASSSSAGSSDEKEMEAFAARTGKALKPDLPVVPQQSVDSGISAVSDSISPSLISAPEASYNNKSTLPSSMSIPCNLSALDNISLSASDSGSLNELKNNKKKRSFFNFRRVRKEKKEIL